MKRGLAVPLVALILGAFSCLAEEELPQRLFRERWQERQPGRAAPDVRHVIDPLLSGGEVTVRPDAATLGLKDG